ncbi:MAG: sodium/hydrogen exchanger [Candidatus Sumerlaea sp.]|nr:MAG: sodium/hydrogen exchanger [Candidatus Sumerlaea sp.]
MNAKSTLKWISLVLVGASVGIVLRVSGIHLSPPTAALTGGLSILCAAFLLTWACDAVQPDMSRSLSLAILALIAVLPEYAVDMYFTWQAGRHPEGQYASYAVANMTGANRLLLGLGWAFICFVSWWRMRRPVTLEPNQRTEVLFLGLATLYAFVVPMKQSIEWYDGLVLIGLYVWYIVLASQKPLEEVEEGGPVEFLLHLPAVYRRLTSAVFFLVAGMAIFACSEPFCEGLLQTGRMLHINEFFLVQWLAPIASETPEFIVAVIFALRGRPELSMATLLSSKLNQWTLLVGLIPWVYAVAYGSLTPPIPMSSLQLQEILLTAAQSLFGVAILAKLRFDVVQGGVLFILFASQLVLSMAVSTGATALQSTGHVHHLFSVIYVVLAILIMVRQYRALWTLRFGANLEVTRRGGEVPTSPTPPRD